DRTSHARRSVQRRCVRDCDYAVDPRDPRAARRSRLMGRPRGAVASYVAFLLSFAVILIMWVNHHELMRMVGSVTYPFLFATGLLLLTVTFVPFPTAVLAAYLGTAEARTAVAFYCATFVVNALVWRL